jgi:hypothetical protein
MQGVLGAFAGFAVIGVGAYALDVYEARKRDSSAGSQADEAQAPAATRRSVKEALSGLCPNNRSKSAPPTDSGSQAPTQPIELDPMPALPPSGDDEQLEESAHDARK